MGASHLRRGISLPFVDLLLPVVDLSLLVVDLSLPFVDLPLPFFLLEGRTSTPMPLSLHAVVSSCRCLFYLMYSLRLSPFFRLFCLLCLGSIQLKTHPLCLCVLALCRSSTSSGALSPETCAVEVDTAVPAVRGPHGRPTRLVTRRHSLVCSTCLANTAGDTPAFPCVLHLPSMPRQRLCH